MADSIKNGTVSEDSSVNVLKGVIDNEVEVEELSCFFFTVDSVPRRWFIRIYSNRYPLNEIFHVYHVVIVNSYRMNSTFYFTHSTGI